MYAHVHKYADSCVQMHIHTCAPMLRFMCWQVPVLPTLAHVCMYIAAHWYIYVYNLCTRALYMYGWLEQELVFRM